MEGPFNECNTTFYLLLEISKTSSCVCVCVCERERERERADEIVLYKLASEVVLK